LARFKAAAMSIGDSMALPPRQQDGAASAAGSAFRNRIAWRVIAPEFSQSPGGLSGGVEAHPIAAARQRLRIERMRRAFRHAVNDRAAARAIGAPGQP